MIILGWKCTFKAIEENILPREYIDAYNLSFDSSECCNK